LAESLFGDRHICSTAIVDKNASIGKNCTITNAAGVQELEDEDSSVYIRSGFVVILRNATNI
jgi:glucose-1-phosphate adenylyltransferase